MVCQQAYEAGSVVTLTAAPAPDSVFGGWSGACSGTQPTCSVTVSSDLAVGATFRGPQTLMLTVDSLEQGSGSVHVSPTDTDCANAPGSPQTCSTLHPVGTVLTLTPLSSPDSVFAGWSGACSGTEPCQVTMDEARVAIAVFRGPQTLMLTADSLEQGSGTVHVSPPDTNCANAPGSPHTCSTLHQVGSVLTLTPLPSPDSVFASWSGACSGSGPCQVTMDEARVAIAVFRGPQTLMLTVDSLEQGSGTVHVSPPDADCANTPGSPHTCSTLHQVGTVLTLTPLPSPDSVFAGWSGACSGSGPCQVTMDEARVAIAVFRGPQTLMLTVDSLEQGSGTVHVSPPDTNCANAPGSPQTCPTLHRVGTVLTLTPLPSPDSVFAGWSGACSGSGPCQLAMDAARVVVAVFRIANHPPTANAGGPYAGTRLQAVSFSGAASSDPDGDALSYAWDFGDGGTAPGVAPTHHYAGVGTFTVTLTVNDGTVPSAPVATTVQIANVEPSVRLIGPADGSVFTLPAIVSVTAEASDLDGSIGRVEFYAGATLIGVDPTAPYEAAWSGAPAGVYLLTARAVDSDGTAVTSPAVSVLLNSPPSVSLVAPSDGAQFAAGSTIALGATGADVDGVVTQVEFFAGATSLGVDTSSPYAAELVGAPVGVYSLTARATDDRGAVVSSAAITVRVTASLAPTADAEVRGSNPNTNYGAAGTLAVQQGSSASNQRWSYLKLDLSTAPSVSNAKLRVFGAVNATTSTVIQMAAYSVSDTGWSETGIRWNNKPASGATPLSSVTIVSSSTTGRWYELDVTTYLAQEKAAGRNVVTLVLKNLANSTRYVSLSSRQAATNKPELLVVP